MSRADAQRILTEIRATLPEFSTPDATPEILQEVSDIAATHGILQESLDRGFHPGAVDVRYLRARVAALQAERLLASESQPYRATLAAVITLYGISDNTVQCAADLAARKLNLPSRDHVRLQDSSHVRTATLTGTRYIFTSHQP